jgi:hypothetical protein
LTDLESIWQRLCQLTSEFNVTRNLGARRDLLSKAGIKSRQAPQRCGSKGLGILSEGTISIRGWYISLLNAVGGVEDEMRADLIYGDKVARK